MSYAPNEGKPLSISDTFQLNTQRDAFRLKLLNHWNETKNRTASGRPIDAIISPVAPSLAPKHNATRWWGYTSYWNLADYPAAVFPVGQASHIEQGVGMLQGFSRQPGETLQARNGVERFVADQWDPSLYEKLPVCLQLVGRRLNEEKVLGMLKEVVRAMGIKTEGEG